MAQDNSIRITHRRRQISLFDLFGVTCIVAIWFGLFLVAADAAYFLVGVFIGAATAFIIRKTWVLTWLPLVVIINLIILILFFWWMVPSSSDLVRSIITGISLISIAVFTITNTRRAFEHSPNPKGIVLKAIGFSSVAGCRVGLMIGIPIALATIVSNIFRMDPVNFGLWLAIAVAISLAGFLFGYVAGLPLGVILYFVVKNDCKNRQLGSKQNTGHENWK